MIKLQRYTISTLGCFDELIMNIESYINYLRTGLSRNSVAQNNSKSLIKPWRMLYPATEYF